MREQKFKVGDKVRVVENRSGSVNPVGSIGIIVSLNDCNYSVKVEGVKGSGNAHVEWDLELVKSLRGIELSLSKLLEIDLEVSHFYSIEITKHEIKLQGDMKANVVFDLITLGYTAEEYQGSTMYFNKDNVRVVLT